MIIENNLDNVKITGYASLMKNAAYHHGDLKNAMIKAGVEILAKEGVTGFSLRKAAMKAGVSHSAPYAHFRNKQELIAAISIQGFSQLHQKIKTVSEMFKTEPRKQLLEVAWAYVHFAQQDPDFFKVIFSGMLENEKKFPGFVEVSHQTFQLVVDVVSNNQKVKEICGGDANIAAVSMWSTVHGFTSLLLENQISHKVLEGQTVKELLEKVLDRKYLKT